MKRTAKNILFHELIGLKAKVVESKNKFLVGLEGVIVDETMNMLILESDGKIKKIPKAHVSILLELPSGERVIVDGRYLVGRPEDRLKKKVPSW